MIAADFCSALHVGSVILSRWGIAKHGPPFATLTLHCQLPGSDLDRRALRMAQKLSNSGLSGRRVHPPPLLGFYFQFSPSQGRGLGQYDVNKLPNMQVMLHCASGPGGEARLEGDRTNQHGQLSTNQAIANQDK
ncbi:hypothetical protein THAOC_19225 [Thalassiosira oceanica]|uniref:Uncharacterized protein n=1 Tax=Thalassiosira oceanica TaxID=159749 RepID=K0S2U8_THAOC|nr:hypothetical protein THAOC_19225 [Thalassiosira oceanica]|eukprot:EJK60428.1 hypothetical protein THAOC_19225 [Thalassiosira oceanica]